MNSIENLLPIVYNFNVIDDMPPTLLVVNPEDEFSLDETGKINLNIQINDDYGFSKLWIEYMIKKPSYLNQNDTAKYEYEIKNFNLNNTMQVISHSWDINNISLYNKILYKIKNI